MHTFFRNAVQFNVATTEEGVRDFDWCGRCLEKNSARNKSRSNFGQERCEHFNFASRFAVIRVSFASKFSRESSAWALLKRRLVFLSYSSFTFRVDVFLERVQRELFSKEDLYFCRIRLLHFASKFFSREFSVSSSQKKTSIFVVFMLHFASKFSSREFNMGCFQKKTSVFVVFVFYISRRRFPRESSAWALLKRRLVLLSYSSVTFRVEVFLERVQRELFSKEDFNFCRIHVTFRVEVFLERVQHELFSKEDFGFVVFVCYISRQSFPRESSAWALL